MRKLLFALSIAFLISGCSKQNKLDNETALKILRENYKQSCKNDVDDFISYAYDGPQFYDLNKYFLDLENQGLVTASRMRNRKNEVTGVKIRYTKKAEREYGAGRGFSSFSADMTKFVPKEIVGISYQENKAIVQFKGDWITTPFIGLQVGKTRCSEEKDAIVRATLIHFDTGWQLQ